MEMETGKLATFIVDDEPDACELLKNLLEMNPLVGTVETANGVDEAMPRIICSLPDVVFLDMEMPGGNGLELIEKLRELHVNVSYVFTTGHIKYAIDALRTQAVDFLVKPIDIDELQTAIMKVLALKNLAAKPLSENGNAIPVNTPKKKMRFSSRNGFILADIDDIIYVKADCNYSEIFLKKNKREMLSVNIGSVAKQLPQDQFFRIHRSVLINLTYLARVDRATGNCHLEHEGETTTLPIPRNKIKELEDRFS